MRYYVYELVVMPDQRVCYVGKGSGQRMYHHAKMLARKPGQVRNQASLYRDLRATLRTGKALVPRKVFETDDELAALRFEAARIRDIGFDNLFNRATHAFLGRTLKEDTKRVLAEEARRMWRDPAYRSKNHTVKGLEFAYRTKEKLRAPKRGWGKHGKGVSMWKVPNKRTRWQARITVGSKLTCLGYFPSPQEAAFAYDNASEQHFHTRPNGTNPFFTV